MLLLRNNNEFPEATLYQECKFSHFQLFLVKYVINSELTLSSVVEPGFVVRAEVYLASSLSDP